MNKVALITGGARRIGAETANYLHSKGINIVITYSKSSAAANALKNGKSLLAAGIKIISGKFEKGENIYRKAIIPKQLYCECLMASVPPGQLRHHLREPIQLNPLPAPSKE